MKTTACPICLHERHSGLYCEYTEWDRHAHETRCLCPSEDESDLGVVE